MIVFVVHLFLACVYTFFAAESTSKGLNRDNLNVLGQFGPSDFFVPASLLSFCKRPHAKNVICFDLSRKAPPVKFRAPSPSSKYWAGSRDICFRMLAVG